MAGAEFDSSDLPGTYGINYIYPPTSEFNYFTNQGLNNYCYY